MNAQSMNPHAAEVKSENIMLAPKNLTTATEKFIHGKVWGFDLGTGSIAHAVRSGAVFRDVGVLICDSEIGALVKRNERRRIRRTLRSRNYRRKWTTERLERIGLPKPNADFYKKQANESHEQFQHRTNPVILRCRALSGEPLDPMQLHVAISHLWKRRGYEPAVPWSKESEPTSRKRAGEKDKSEWEGMVSPEQNQKEFNQSGDEYPAQFLKRLMESRIAANTWPRGKYDQRRRVWLRELLVKEFRAIVAKNDVLQKDITFTNENGKTLTIPFAQWLLFGDGELRTRNGKEFRWYEKSSQGRNPGVLGLKWPRFNNRNPSLDLLHPYDEYGRPQHVVSKDSPIARQAMWKIATANFMVTDLKTGKRVRPSQESLVKLEEIWLNSLTKKEREKYLAGHHDFDVKISAKDKLNKNGEVSKESILVLVQRQLEKTS
jgi:hypothetical protein